MTECDYGPNRQKIAEAFAIIARASADADAAAHQPGKNDARFISDLWQREFTLRTGLELSRSEVQSLLTTADSDPAPGNRKKKPEIYWHPEWMLLEAARLGQVVDRLDAPEHGRDVRFDRSPIAVPVLLALAIELALKALQWKRTRRPATRPDARPAGAVQGPEEGDARANRSEHARGSRHTSGPAAPAGDKDRVVPSQERLHRLEIPVRTPRPHSRNR